MLLGFILHSIKKFIIQMDVQKIDRRVSQISYVDYLHASKNGDLKFEDFWKFPTRDRFMAPTRNFWKTAPVIGFEDPFGRGGQVLKVVQGKLVLEAVVQDWSSYGAETSFFQ